MKTIARFFKFSAGFYKGFSYVLATLAALNLIAVVLYWTLHSARFAPESLMYGLTHDPGLQESFLFRTSGVSILNLVRISICAWLNAIIFESFGKFIEGHKSGDSLETLRLTLLPVPKYLLLLYPVGALSLLHLSPESSTSPAIERVTEVLDYVIPSFDGPVGLVIALVVFLYCKSLQEQSAIQEEASRMKQDAELVI